MKTLKIVASALLVGLLCGQTSCRVAVKSDNGKHKGWFMNKHNPHNPANKGAAGNGKKN